jgi:Protein of unknown function (DUF3574)
MRTRRSHLLSVFLIALIPACSSAEPAVVAPAPQPGGRQADEARADSLRGTPTMVRDELFFGRRLKEGGIVSDEEWSAFVESVVAPRVPGMTVVDAHGLWRNMLDETIHEPTKILIIVHGGKPEHERAIREIIDAYKQRFAQESVMRVTTEARVEF